MRSVLPNQLACCKACKTHLTGMILEVLLTPGGTLYWVPRPLAPLGHLWPLDPSPPRGSDEIKVLWLRKNFSA